jgi:diguanylate cyclase (GGDEF)-like protein
VILRYGIKVWPYANSPGIHFFPCSWLSNEQELIQNNASPAPPMSAPTLDRVIDVVARIDHSGGLAFMSEPGLGWFGVTSTAQLPTSFLDLLHPVEADAFREQFASLPDTFVIDARLLKGGNEVWTNIRGYQLPDARQYLICILDISPWKSDQTALRHAAEHDELTGLPNRTALRHAFEDLKQRGQIFTVALLDLDGFKKVNDTFGHGMGDAVLKETTRRLGKLMGANDVLARLGGDEFVMILAGANATDAGARLASVLLAIARPYDTAPHNAYLGVSIGLAEYPLHGDDYSTVLKNADTAMYFSKNAGKNRITVFTETTESVDFSINAAIHHGIQEGEFYLEFQPQYNIERRLVGAEALMRWSSRTFGRVPPDKFIPIVEESGLMPFLGKWALRYACHQLRRFHELMPDFVMSINVSPVQFGSEDFDTLVLEVIAETGVDSHRVILEITESTLMQSQEKTERALAKLREHGIRFSIDDFGTGFSSLAYLTRLPVSSIKIDKAFIRAIENPRENCVSDQKLVTAMIDLAHNINLKVVAEGVETEEQFSFLKQAGCNLIQGYLLSKPVSGAAITSLLEAAV